MRLSYAKLSLEGIPIDEKFPDFQRAKEICHALRDFLPAQIGKLQLHRESNFLEFILYGAL